MVNRIVLQLAGHRFCQKKPMDGTHITAENHLRVVHADTPDNAELATGYIYTLLDRDGNPVYTGSCRDVQKRGREACLARRFTSHRI